MKKGAHLRDHLVELLRPDTASDGVAPYPLRDLEPVHALAGAIVDADLRRVRHGSAVIVVGGCRDEGRIAAVRQCTEPLIDDRESRVTQHAARFFGFAIRSGIEGGQPVEENKGLRAGLDKEFHICRMLRGRHIARHVAGRGARFPVGKRSFDLVLDLLRIDIAHDDKRRAFRPVPGVVEAAHQFGIGARDNVFEAYRHQRRSGTRTVEEAEFGFLQVLNRNVVQARFGQNHVAFGIQRDLTDVEIARDLAHQHEAGVERHRVILGHVEHVDGLRRLRVGIGVGAECQPEALQFAYHIAICDMLRTTKRHVVPSASRHPCANARRARLWARCSCESRSACHWRACRNAHPDRPAGRSSAAATA